MATAPAAARWIPARKQICTVMPGLDPGIHLLARKVLEKKMDCRVKPGNDGR